MNEQFWHELTDQEAQAVSGGIGQVPSYIAIGPGGGCLSKTSSYIAIGPGGGCLSKTQQLNKLVVWHMNLES
jgi:hypothetical protein